MRTYFVCHQKHSFYNSVSKNVLKVYILRIQILQEKNELEKSDEMYLKGIHLNPKEQNQQYIGECFYLKSGVFTARAQCGH